MKPTPHPEIVRISLPTPFPVGPVNVFLVKDDIPTLVDAGARMLEAYDKLRARLQENGLSIKDIGRVLLTHGHLDHVGLLQEIVEDSGAEVYAHPYVVEQYRYYEQGIDDGVAFLEDIMRRFGVPEEQIEQILAVRSVFNTLASPMDIRCAVADCENIGGFVACYVPGHSAADVIYFDPQRRVAFTGDHVLRNVSPNPLLRKPRPGQERPRSLVEYQHSLRRTYALDIDVCYAGHGEPFGNHRKVIDGLLERHERRTGEIRAMLEGRSMTPHEVSMALFPKIDIRMLHMGLSVAIGHLDVLEERGDVLAEERDGIVYYRLRT